MKTVSGMLLNNLLKCKKLCVPFYERVCGHMRVCADKQVLLPVHSRAYGQLNTQLKSHYPCWEMEKEQGVS